MLNLLKAVCFGVVILLPVQTFSAGYLHEYDVEKANNDYAKDQAANTKEPSDPNPNPNPNPNVRDKDNWYKNEVANTKNTVEEGSKDKDRLK